MPTLPEGSRLVKAFSPTRGWLLYSYGQGVLRFSGLLLFFFLGPTVTKNFGQNIGDGTGKLVDVAFVFAIVSTTLAFVANLVGRRVDFELRHYLIGDRSLRIAHGVFRREEVTVSYANIQNIEVSQGPMERLFGFKRLAITNANAAAGGDGTGHVVQLLGVDSAETIREMIIDLQRGAKDSGLGESTATRERAEMASVALLDVQAAALALKAAVSMRLDLLASGEERGA